MRKKPTSTASSLQILLVIRRFRAYCSVGHPRSRSGIDNPLYAMISSSRSMPHPRGNHAYIKNQCSLAYKGKVEIGNQRF
jgi:hypothetical protein